MTSAEISQGDMAALAAIRSLLCRALLVVALALAPALTPYLLTPAFAPRNEVASTQAGTHAGAHTGAHAGHPAEAPSKDPHVHPHCLRCVLFASSLPARVVLTPSAPLVRETSQLDVGFPPSRRFNPNVGARAPPDGARHS